MISFITILLIIPPILTSIENYKQFCNLEFGSDLTNLLDDYIKPDDCDHSSGFHFNTQLCSLFPMISSTITEQTRNMTAFQSEDKLYFYYYVSLSVKDIKRNESFSGQNRTFSINLPRIVRNGLFRGGYLFVLWLKEQLIFTTLRKNDIDVYYNWDSFGQIYRNSTKFHLSQNEEQLVLKDWTPGQVYIKRNAYSDNILREIKITDSYLIYCWKKTKETLKGCKPVVETINENQRIHCVCEIVTHNNIIVYYLSFWGLTMILLAMPFFELILNVEKSGEKTNYDIVHNCNKRNHKFKYIIAIRLAKTYIFSDLNNVTIDVEFFTDKNESIAPNFRFTAKVLEKKPIIDINLIIWRLTKLSPLRLVQCSHTGSADTKICLVGIFTKCIAGDTEDNKVSWFKVNKNICRNQRQFSLQMANTEFDFEGMEEMPLKSLSIGQIGLGYVEVVFFLIIVFSFIALIVDLVPNDLSTNIWLKNLIPALIIAIIGSIVLVLLVVGYKCLLLKSINQKIKIQSQWENFYITAVLIIYFLGFVLTLVLNITVIVRKMDDTDIEDLRWFSISVLSTSLVIMFWKIYEQYIKALIFRSFKTSERSVTIDSEMTVNSVSVNETI